MFEREAKFQALIFLAIPILGLITTLIAPLIIGQTSEAQRIHREQQTRMALTPSPAAP